MGSLFINEWIKLWTKKMPWIFLILIVVFMGIVSFMYHSFEADTALDSENWRVQLESEIEQDRELLQEEGVSDWERDFAQQDIERNEAFLAADINPRQVNNVTFMNDTILGVASFVTLFSVIVASTIVSSEFTTGTIKQLVIRPYERWQFLLSKFLTVVAFAFVLVGTLFVSNYLLGMILFDTVSWSTPIMEQTFNGVGAQESATILIFSKLGLYSLNMLVFVVISFALSTLFKSQALAVGVGIFALFFTSMSQALTMVLGDTVWYKFIILPHLSLTQYVSQDTLMDGVTLPFSLAILAFYVIIMLGLTTFIFQKKDIAY
ncbi:ABC transporter permease [Evansella sp. AB-rgal1]|uniref:ABC transporter permease n=1 Tax=Evansella sp. AB-rgal1 TaxID=3242696 RepID=UPI00359D41B6